MKLNLIENRILTGILFILPFMAIFLLVEKIWHRFKSLSEEVEEITGTEAILGAYTTTFWIIVLLLTLVYVAGYLAHLSLFSKLHDAVDNSFLQFVPGYLVYKNKMNEKFESKNRLRKPVYFINENEKKPAILIEQSETEAVLFVPSVPDTNSGEVVIVPIDTIQHIDMEYRIFIKNLQLSGKGLLAK